MEAVSIIKNISLEINIKEFRGGGICSVGMPAKLVK